MALYKKKCVYCGKEYESTSRNQRYCSQECCDKAQVKNYKQKKTRARKRREYTKTQEIQKALAQAYALAHRVADVYGIPKVCQCRLSGEVSENNECSGDLELHHRDSDPFNNAPWNLGYWCEKHHKMEHSKVGRVNVVKAFQDAQEETKDLDEDMASEVLVGSLHDLVDKAAIPVLRGQMVVKEGGEDGSDSKR